MGEKLRLLFGKTGKAKYFSHLDLMETMRRAFLRAGLRLKYSEGFNPHPLMSAALPLSVGQGSICELLDFQPLEDISPEGLPDVINAALPSGLEVFEAYYPVRKFAEIAWIDIQAELFYDAGLPEGCLDRLYGRLGADEIIITKKTKRGEKTLDIAPLFKDMELMSLNDGKAEMRVKVSAQNPTLNPEDLFAALREDGTGLAPDYCAFMRKDVYDAAMNIFR